MEKGFLKKFKMGKYQELLFLARASLEAHFKGKNPEIPLNIKEKYSDKGACFVTLTKDGDLRGCIGSLEARQPLYEDVIQNTINAGFHDYRFPALEEDELEEIKIEISIISKPKKLGKGKNVFDKIKKNMGIILNFEGTSATFLPQVWEQIPNKIVFLEELAQKAGLHPDDWKDADLKYYKVEKIKEK